MLAALDPVPVFLCAIVTLENIGKGTLLRICTFKCSCCADIVSRSAKLFGETIMLPFNVTDTAFVVISCFCFSCQRYGGSSFQ